MVETSTSFPIPTPNANRRIVSGFARWLASERVFRLIPFLIVEGLFVLTILVPFALTIWISLLKWRANRPFETARFAGFENYEAVLTNDQFWLALGRTFYFAGVAVALELIIGFMLAMLVSRCTRSRQLYTTIFLVPMMIVPIVVGYNFSMIYIDSGPLNQILAPFMEGFGIDPRIRWLSHPDRCAMGDYHRRHLAVDVPDLPYFSVRLRCVTASTRQCGPCDGRITLADVLADRASPA